MVECNPPDPELYMEVGYNRHPGDNMKHYRYYIQEELENTDYVEKSPFHFFDIRRG